MTAYDFDSKRNDAELWLPALRAIAERHELTGPIAIFPTGSAVVCSVGDRWVIKLHEPWCRALYATERVLLGHLDGRLPVATPGLIADGDIEGWGYLVMRRLPGLPLSEVRDAIYASELCRVAHELGELVAATQAVSIESIEWPAIPWHEFIEAQRAACVTWHRAHGVPERLLETLPDQIDGADVTTSRPVLLHTEWTDTNVLVEHVAGRWQLSGAFDFEPSMSGHRLYDLPSLTVFVARGHARVARAALAGYGLRNLEKRDATTETLRRDLLAHALLHRYSNLERLLGLVGVAEYPATWAEISTALSGL